MLKHRFFLLLTLTATLLCMPAYAQNAPVSGGGSPDVPLTRLSFVVGGVRSTQHPEADAVQNGIEEAQKRAAKLAAKWPKCNFRIESIAEIDGSREDLLRTMREASSPLIVVQRVTIVGDKDCLR